MADFSPPLVIPKGTTKTLSLLVQAKPPLVGGIVSYPGVQLYPAGTPPPPVLRGVEYPEVPKRPPAPKRTTPATVSRLAKDFTRLFNQWKDIEHQRRVAIHKWEPIPYDLEARMQEVATALRLTGEAIARQYRRPMEV